MCGVFVEKTVSSPAWTFLTNHSHVLLCIAREPEARMRDMAERVGITERAVQRIIDDLSAAGYLHIEREGRRNRYSINTALHLRHPVEWHCEVAGLIAFVTGQSPQPDVQARGREPRREKGKHAEAR